MKAFTRSAKAASAEEADATWVLNIMRFCEGAFSDLTDDHRAWLEELTDARNELAHPTNKKLTASEKKVYVALYTKVLASGPWTQPPFADAAEAALLEVKEWARDPWTFTTPVMFALVVIAIILGIFLTQGWRLRVNSMPPPLPQLVPHYVRQRHLIDNVTHALQQHQHRIVALSGLGGVGKSTTALAVAWQLVNSGTCPGVNGVLWASASRGMALHHGSSSG